MQTTDFWKLDWYGDGGQVTYAFCVLDKLQTALKRRDLFAAPSWRYADPRTGLLDGAEWEATRPLIWSTLWFVSQARADAGRFGK